MIARHLIIGYGEIGQAIEKVLQDIPENEIEIVKGRGGYVSGRFDIIHICFPYSEDFVEQVRSYYSMYAIEENPLVIIHSTVKVGTTEQIPNAVHSPCRGVHPNLYEGLKTFVKYFGGQRAMEAAQAFEDCGVKTYTTTDIRTVEAIKLWDTTYYGWNIVFQKLVKKWCDDNGLDFSVIYTDANNTYNIGYRELGRPEVVRPVLNHVDGKIGGHCVIPNCQILGGEISEFILKQNDLL